MSSSSRSLGAGFCCRNAWAFITKPGVQKPHCVPLFAAMQCWTGSSPSRTLPIPSMVVTIIPSTAQSGRRHELVARCDGLPVTRSRCESITVHAPPAPLPAAHLRPDKTYAMKVVDQHDRRVGIVDDHFTAVEAKDELLRVLRRGSRHLPGRADLSGADPRLCPIFLMTLRVTCFST